MEDYGATPFVFLQEIDLGGDAYIRLSSVLGLSVDYSTSTARYCNMLKGAKDNDKVFYDLGSRP